MLHHIDADSASVGLGAEGTRYVSFEGRHWHSGCFSCYTCDVSLVGKGFLVHNDNIVCPDCDRKKQQPGCCI